VNSLIKSYKKFSLLLNFLIKYGYRPLPDRIKNRLKPKILLLKQYEPRPIILPQDYNKNFKNNEKLTVSIVTPSFNQGKFIEKTISSVLSQSYDRIQYIVQDGGSIDDTIQIIKKKLQQADFDYESRRDKGQAHAINLGFQKSEGEIMAWLNSDDLLLPGAVSFAVDFFNRNPDVDAIYGHRILINSEGQEIGRWVLPPHLDAILRYNDFIPQESLFWRKSLWDKAGGFVDENFSFAMDWELLTRFISCGAKIVRVPRFLGAFRVHHQQKSTVHENTLGRHEMEKVRTIIHKRKISEEEIFKNIVVYILLSCLFNLGYRLRILNY
jgi:glycosyltransferase involved in cell wall biosynthesis